MTHLHRQLIRTGRRIGLATATAALAIAAAASAAPPVAPHVVVARPSTDGVSLEGYAAGVPLTVQVLRGGNLVNQVVVTPAAGPGGGGGGGGAAEVVADVNNVEGGACWPGFTPDIAFGDVVRVVSPGLVEDATVQNLTIDPPQETDPGEVAFTGTAQTPSGAQLAIDGLELLMPGDFESSTGGPFLRLPGAPGSLLYTPPSGTTWTGTFVGLSPADVATALAAPASISWASGAGEGGEVTEVELGATGGPQGACTSPLRVNAATSTTPTSYRFDSTTLAIHGIAAPDVTAVSVTVSDTNPLTPDLQLGPVAPTSAGGGQTWTLTASAAQAQALADGTLAITPHFTIAGNQVTGGLLTITKDMVPPDVTPPIASIVSRPKAFVASTVATFALVSTEPGRLECSLDAGPFATCFASAVFTSLRPGAHRLAVRAVDGSGNVGPEAGATWVVDLTAPRVTASITAANRRTLTTTGRPVGSVRCSEVCTVTARARIVIAGQSFSRTTPRAITLPGARTRGIGAAVLTAPQRAAVRQAIRRGVPVRLFLTVTATDRAGNRTRVTASVTLRSGDL